MYLSYQLKTRLVTVRTHGQIVKRLNRELMEHIRDVFWPKHFQNSPETVPGGGGYGYRRRTRKYQLRKMRAKGHNLPLVWSGETRREIKSSAKISSTSKGSKLKARGKNVRWHTNRKEIEAVSRREQRELSQRYGKGYAALANLPEYQEFRLKKPAVIG